MTHHTDPYPERVLALEAEGMTTSDAQAVADAELMGAKPMRRARGNPAERVAGGNAPRDWDPCLCGCGEVPKGKKSRFMPGHDAHYHAARKKASAVASTGSRAAGRARTG